MWLYLTYDVIMYRLRPQSLICLASFALLAAAGSAMYAQTKQVKMVPAQSTNAWKGDDLYREFCAVCHGVDGTGSGPAADALKVKPSNLTQISRQSNGKFPAMHMQRVVSGDDVVQAHGNRDMPTWGNTFKDISANSTFAEMRVNALVDYLKTIQR